MVSPIRKCDNDGRCYYIYTDAWHIWGRWLFLGLLLLFVIFLIPFSGYLMSVWRMRRGLPPVSGCSWMFPDPFKNAEGPKIDSDNQLGKPQRYRPYNTYLQYQRDQMHNQQIPASINTQEYRHEYSSINNGNMSGNDLEKNRR